MLFFIIQIILLSLIFIFLIHHIINFLKNTLTVTKIKDIVNLQNEKYDNILSILSNSNSTLNKEYNNFIPLNNNNINNSTPISSLDNINYNIGNNTENNSVNNSGNNSGNNKMKNELKNFIKSQFKVNNINSYNINNTNNTNNNNFSSFI